MTGVTLLEVRAEEADQRLDRWFRRRFPELSHIRLEKLLRTGQVRVDGGRVRAGHRLDAGMTIRVPPLSVEPAAEKAAPRPSARDVKDLEARILYRDGDVLAIDKPAGLAVQGGTGTSRHIDGMLDALQLGAAERPRLVHRLDKGTSGVLLLARTAQSAAWLTRAFREKTTRKLYWALVAGVPRPAEGRITLAVERKDGEADGAREAVTDYAVIDHAGQKAAWLALLPRTGRTHQLRIHCNSLGTPIVGDDKYGFDPARERLPWAGQRLHLHARHLMVTAPDGRRIDVTAPLPTHMLRSWELLGFSPSDPGDPFDSP